MSTDAVRKLARPLSQEEADHVARMLRRGIDPGVSYVPQRGEAYDTARDTWPTPDLRLVDDDRPPAPPLVDDAAGWAEWITAEAAASSDYIAAGLIDVASAWIGNARRIAATAAEKRDSPIMTNAAVAQALAATLKVDAKRDRGLAS